MRIFKINGERNKILNNWTVKNTVNNIGTFSFTVRNNQNINDGDIVEFLNDNTTIFEGFIQTHDITFNGDNRYTKCTACNNSGYAKRKLIVVAEDNKTDEYIIRNKVLPLLAVFGITAGTIEEGQSYSKIRYDYQSCENLLNTFSDNSGYVWYIDNNMKLNYHSKKKNRKDMPKIYKDFKYTSDNTEYRNSVLIKGGQITSNIMLTANLKPIPNGENSLFYTVYPIGKVVEISLNGEQQTVGVKGLDENQNVFWSYGSNELNFNTAPEIDSILLIKYYPVVRTLVRSENIQEKEKRGLYEKYQKKTDISEIEALRNYSDSQISKYSQPIEKCEFSTVFEDCDIQAGSIVKIENSKYNISKDFLCESCTITGKTVKIQKKYSFVSGNYIGGWDDYFKSVKNPETTSIGENENIEIYETQNEKTKQIGRYFVIDEKSIFCSISLPCSISNKVHRGQKFNVND